MKKKPGHGKKEETLEPVIVADSCCDVNPELLKKLGVKLVPFTIDIQGKVYLDDGSIDLEVMREEMTASETIPKTAGVTPQRFYEAAKDAEEAFFVTISQKLSSTYNNAVLAARQLIEEGKKVHVFDSKAACSGETIVAQKIRDLIDEKLPFEQIVEQVDEFIRNATLWFVIEDLGVLVKAGRIPKLAGSVLSRLTINPICYAQNGAIALGEVRRGMESALNHLCLAIEKQQDVDWSNRVLIISHNRYEKKAWEIAKRLEKLPWKGVEVVEARGLTSVYAHPGGLIISY